MKSFQRLIVLFVALCLLLSAGALLPAMAEDAWEAADGADQGEPLDGATSGDLVEDTPLTDDPMDDGAGSASEADDFVPDWAEDLDEGAAAPQAAEGLEVYFLDLGRVDGILIRCDGVNSFIDVGYEKSAGPAIKYLKYLGVERLDSYIASHAHADHVGGAARIIEAFQPGKIYVNHSRCMQAIREPASKSALAAIEAAEQIVVRSGDSFMIGSAEMRCLGPQSIVKCSTSAYQENYNSLILRMDYNGHSFLFTGDTHDDMMRNAAKKYPGGLDVDVFKNPHHNGKHDDDVINLVNPKITVFCTENEHQPASAYVRHLKRLGSQIYITGSKNQGNVCVACQGTEMEVRCGYPVSSVSLEPVPDLYVGQVYTVNGAMEPKKYSKTEYMSLKSSDRSVLRTSGDRIKAVGPGTATLTATSFNGLTASVEVNVNTAVVQLEHSELTVAVGEMKKLRVRVLPEGVTGVTGEWINSDTSVATVSQKGEVWGIRQGTTQLTARLSNGAEATCTVVVSGFMVDEVTLDRKKAKMKVGDNLTLKASVKPAGLTDIPLQWASSNEKVLWVDNDGNVTAVGKGTAKIGVRASEGKYAVCTIKVE